MNKYQSILSALAILVVEIAGMFNLTLDRSVAELIVTGVLMFAILVWGIYKNHNLSDAANLGEQVIKSLKRTDVSGLEAAKEAADEYIGKHINA